MYEYSTISFINYVQQEYSTGVYLRKEIREGKVPDLALPTKPKKNKNQSDDELYMDLFGRN